jgi:GNAT superfamily N-acetyltransferase
LLTVRPAVEADLQRAAEILERAGSAPASRVGHQLLHHPHLWLGTLRELSEAYVAPTSALYVGLLDAYVVGVVVCHEEHDMDGTGLTVVRSLLVEEPFRELGVGEGLLDAAIAWGAGRGHRAVDVSVLPGDRLTKNLLERSGFRARKLVMHRELDVERASSFDE